MTTSSLANEPICVSSGVDWITGVATEEDSALKLAALGHDLFWFEHERGAIKRGWGMAGFTGFKAGECELGFRGKEVIVRLMSGLAQNCWRSVYQAADSVTRIDLQYTLDHKSPVQPIIEKFYEAANESASALGGKRINRIIRGNDGGATLYCGARQSDCFGRIYAKGPQMKDKFFETCIRYEVQYQKRLAKLVSRKLAQTSNIDSLVCASTDTFFTKRIRNFPKRTRLIVNYSCSRKRTDLEQRLEWLANHVKPSVQMLRERGRLGELLDALGLTNYVTINSAR